MHTFVCDFNRCMRVFENMALWRIFGPKRDYIVICLMICGGSTYPVSLHKVILFAGFQFGVIWTVLLHNNVKKSTWYLSWIFRSNYVANEFKWNPLFTILFFSIWWDEKSMLDAALIKPLCAKMHTPQELLTPFRDIDAEARKDTRLPW
jgi:hypothetical protein